MKPLRSGNLTASFASLLVFALFCAIVAYWVMQLTGRKPSVAPPEIVSDPRASTDLAAAGGLFGRASTQTGSAPPPEVSNIQVVGIAADASRGAAILAVDGKPGKPFLVGDTIVAGTRLVEVKASAVIIDRGGSRIELPVPERPSIALLTSGQAGSASTTPGRGGAARPTPLPSSPSPALPLRPLPPSGAAAGPSAGTPFPPPPPAGQSGMSAPATVGAAPPAQMNAPGNPAQGGAVQLNPNHGAPGPGPQPMTGQAPNTAQ